MVQRVRLDRPEADGEDATSSEAGDDLEHTEAALAGESGPAEDRMNDPVEGHAEAGGNGVDVHGRKNDARGERDPVPLSEEDRAELQARVQEIRQRLDEVAREMNIPAAEAGEPVSPEEEAARKRALREEARSLIRERLQVQERLVKAAEAPQPASVSQNTEKAETPGDVTLGSAPDHPGAAVSHRAEKISEELNTISPKLVSLWNELHAAWKSDTANETDRTSVHVWLRDLRKEKESNRSEQSGLGMKAREFAHLSHRRELLIQQLQNLDPKNR